ncbi:hypothetical protein EAE99_007997 [Botrytis elliptica]|nr:hypothetical protein EAE99_007997 [Botrytis elliptica]
MSVDASITQPGVRCDVCYDLDTFSVSGSQQWQLRISSNLSHEHRLEFTSSRLEHAAASNCANCSIILRGLQIMNEKFRLFDQKKPFQGTMVLRRNLPMQLEAYGCQLSYLGRWLKFMRPSLRLRGLQMEVPMKLEYCTLDSSGDDELGTNVSPIFGGIQDVPAEVCLERCRSTIQRWITDCDNQHSTCKLGRDTEARFPSRVIDVLGEDGNSVILVEKVDIAENTGPYTTLSHCWGKSQFIQTRKRNFFRHKKGIPWKSLPKTFQDAITIVRTLDIRYIWIDSLCIIQDNPDDWNKQSVLMADVYANSYLNIAATGSSDSRGGCFRDRSVKYNSSNSFAITPHLVSMEDRQQASKKIYVRPSFEDVHHRFIAPTREQFNSSDDGTTPLLTRAWGFQERQLAPRTVHFHPSEMLMECKAGLRCECTILDRIYARIQRNLPSHDLNVLDENEVLGKWFETVEEYSRLHLSYPSDRLVAIAGVATIFQKRLKCRYLAGLWQCDITRSLLWSVSGSVHTKSDKSLSRSRTSVAPSWSWASLILQKGVTIVFRAIPGDSFSKHESFGCIDPTSTADSDQVPDLRTESKIDRIEVQGLVVSATLVHNMKSGSLLRRGILVFKPSREARKFSIEIESENSTGIIESFVPSGITVICLLVGTKTVHHNREGAQMTWLCTLMCKATMLGEEKVYERIGVFDVCENANVFLEAKEETITLV